MKKKAHYDNYDYLRYWKLRDYEHDSECLAISNIFSTLPKINSLAEVGCGFGRLAPCYSRFAKKITLIDPSVDLLNLAKKNCKDKKYDFKKSTVENINKNLKNKKFDTVLMVRVLHHVEDLDEAFGSINKILKKHGYFVLEFANKMHGKNQIIQFVRGNFTFPLDIFSEDIRSKKNKKNNSILFLNHHPDIVLEKLKANGFVVEKKMSVSNFRFKFFKKFIPLNWLLSLELAVQGLFSKILFGPSMFVVCKKK